MVNVISSLAFSSGGETLLKAVFPMTLMTALLPRRFSAVALASPAVHSVNLKSTVKSIRHQGTLMRAWECIADELLLMMRGVYLLMVFTPSLLLGPLVWATGCGRLAWLQLLRGSLEKAGPAFIKWGQWASTRPDMFPHDLCEQLEKLQTCAPPHSGVESLQLVESAFHCPVNVLFDSFEPAPVASGSIAQIHKATLGARGAALTGYARGTEVAVKVRHPGVTDTMHRDFEVMARMAKAASVIPMFRNLRLEDSIKQFGTPLKEQLDLRVEAQHLNRFRYNFRAWRNVSFPTPIYPLVHTDVLVESFEEGSLISTYVKQPGYKNNDLIAQIGMNVYLKMLLKDNFIHADLHPGNILVREVGHDGNDQMLSGLRAWFKGWWGKSPQLVLIDTGMTAQLSTEDQRNLIAFFKALTRQDGSEVARSILTLSEDGMCHNPPAFVEDMKQMFDSLDAERIRNYTSDVLRDMIETLREHHVTLKSAVSTVVVTTLVLEGWSSKLNPDLRIVDTLKDLLATDWTDRMSRTVDKIMHTGSLAVL